jgi:hypothetical protein
MQTTDDREERLKLEEFPSAPEMREDEMAACVLVELFFGCAAFISPSKACAAFWLVNA